MQNKNAMKMSSYWKVYKWEYPTCDLCGHKEFAVVWKDATTWEHPGFFRVVKCVGCSLVYLNPRPARSEIGKFYPKESYWGRDITNSHKILDWKKERDNAYNIVYNLISSFTKRGAILDIGAGIGLFLTKFSEEGWRIDGVEFSKDAVLYAKKTYGIVLKNGDFFDFEFPEKSFDIVTLNNVLEHLYSPFLTLTQIHKTLKKNGVVIITVPNIDSLGMKIFSSRWHPLQLPRHLYHFSPNTLTKLLKKARFDVLRVDHSFWVHNYYSLFESFRFALSPRFRKKKDGGLLIKNNKQPISLKKEAGKVAGRLFASAISAMEPFLKKGEVIVVCARKT